jgi:hypothetical protein
MAKNTLNVDAVDADADGIVQEGTEFERPATPLGWYIIGEQDTYASLGELLKGKGETGFDKAGELYTLNNGQPLFPGLMVKVDVDADA